MKKRIFYANNTKRKLKERKGTTLVETIVTLLLISIMMAMAASALSSAAKIFVREQKTQFAQSILDTTMTELRGLTSDANGYIKIYGKNDSTSGKVVDMTGNNAGNILEFIDEDGYVVLVSTDGCDATTLKIGGQDSGQAEPVESGQLLTRYYFYNNGKFRYSEGGTPIARAVATVFGKGFYMGNYLEVTWAFPDGIKAGDAVTQITVTVTLYSDKERTHAVASDTEILSLRHKPVRNDAVTAVSDAD